MPRVVITVPGKNSQPYRFSLDRKIVRLGRASDNDIIIDCPSVSSHHCEMRRVEGGYILQDLDSTNGIQADGTQMEVLDLENDTDVLIGDADLDFELTDDERADLRTEAHKPQARPKLPVIDEASETPKPREAPPRQVAPGPRRHVAGTVAASPGGLQSAQQGGAASFLISMVFLGLAILALFMGMSTRHSSQFERSLWNDFFGTPEAAPTTTLKK